MTIDLNEFCSLLLAMVVLVVGSFGISSWFLIQRSKRKSLELRNRLENDFGSFLKVLENLGKEEKYDSANLQ